MASCADAQGPVVPQRSRRDAWRLQVGIEWARVRHILHLTSSTDHTEPGCPADVRCPSADSTVGHARIAIRESRLARFSQAGIHSRGDETMMSQHSLVRTVLLAIAMIWLLGACALNPAHPAIDAARVDELSQRF